MPGPPNDIRREVMARWFNIIDPTPPPPPPPQREEVNEDKNEKNGSNEESSKQQSGELKDGQGDKQE